MFGALQPDLGHDIYIRRMQTLLPHSNAWGHKLRTWKVSHFWRISTRLGELRATLW